MSKTTEQVDNKVPNPTGKGGFADNPQNINAGGRPKNQESFTYWMNHFKELTTKEFLSWPDNNPEKKRTVAADLAYIRVFKARDDLTEFREVANRTEGMPKQPIKHEGEIDLNIKKIETIIDELLDDEETEEKNPNSG